MGRAIVRDLQVFLSDEPLSNLDAKLRVQMRGKIRELHHRLKATSVYVTHDQIEAMIMADKIVVMQDGNIEQVGSPLDLYDHPANLFVAGFAGSPSMNLLDGVVRVGEKLNIQVLDAVLPAPPISGLPERHEIITGIRPEHFELAEIGLRATISVIEPTSADTHVILRIGRQELVAVFRDRHDFKPGQLDKFMPKVEHIHVFDRKTRQNKF